MQNSFVKVARLLLGSSFSLAIAILCIGFTAQAQINPSAVLAKPANLTNTSIQNAVTLTPGVGNGYILNPNLKKLKDQCLRTMGCTQDNDCTFFDCIPGEPDWQASFQGTCVNNKCECNFDVVLNQTPCPALTPRCSVIVGPSGDNTGTKCNQCNDATDCAGKPSACVGINLVDYNPQCLAGRCNYGTTYTQCAVACAVVDGKAKCVDCATDSQCVKKVDSCATPYDKQGFKAICNKNTCINIQSSLTNCGKQFCYQQDDKTNAICVDCVTDGNCKSTDAKKCAANRKSYDTFNVKCQSQKCVATLDKNNPCLAPNPYCQNGACVECQYNTDCASKITNAACDSETTGTNYSLSKAVCTNAKCNMDKTGTPLICPKSGTQPTYCLDAGGKLSCVQCKTDAHCAFTNPNFVCNGNVLESYNATCQKNNRCNAKGTLKGTTDCNALKLDCMADKGRCACSKDSQCSGLPDKLSKCTDSYHYSKFDKICDKTNNCNHTEIKMTCATNTVCTDTADGAKCTACTEDANCTYMAGQSQYQKVCNDKTLTSYTFACQKDDKDPAGNRCIANRSDNPCVNGCYTDNKGVSRCKDCTSSSECTNPPVSYCSTKTSGTYYSPGTCYNGSCSYQAKTLSCGNVPITYSCKNNNTRTISGPSNSCQLQGSNIYCVPDTRFEECVNCKRVGAQIVCQY
ncbi:MAG: hypothetical protein WCO55_03720 [Candidatus Falkowbacteria bacterium]